MTTTQTLGKVVGANLRRIRNEREATLEEVSQAVRERGVEWSVSRVTAIQRGTRQPQLATILLLANALECTVADLLQTDADQVDIGSVAVDSSALRDLRFTGPTPPVAGGEMTDSEWAVTRGYGNAQHMEATIGASVSDLRAWAMKSGLLETRTSTRFDIDLDVLNAVTHRLWGCSLGEMRDRMAEEQGCLPAEVTWNLRELLREEIADWTREQRRPSEFYNPETDDPKPID